MSQASKTLFLEWSGFVMTYIIRSPSQCNDVKWIKNLMSYTMSHRPHISGDIWINTAEQLRCVNWTDEPVLTIVFGVVEQSTIDFSSAGGLRNICAALKRGVLGWLQCKYENPCMYVYVYAPERERERDGSGAGSLAMTFGVFCLQSDISAVKQTRSNMSIATEQRVSLDFPLTFQTLFFLSSPSFIIWSCMFPTLHSNSV